MIMLAAYLLVADMPEMKPAEHVLRYHHHRHHRHHHKEEIPIPQDRPSSPPAEDTSPSFDKLWKDRILQTKPI